MKIFISWSGTLSQEVAELLKSWLENIFQGAEAWMSKDDITKGEIWFTSISKSIAKTDFGILCLTRENMNAPWILFEAGALSKGLSKNHVCPLLIDFEASQLTQPLAQFNASRSSREEMLKLLGAINQHSREKPLPPERLRKTFDKWWDDFAAGLAAIEKKHKRRIEAPKRTVDDMVVEILEIARALQQTSQQDENARLQRWALGLTTPETALGGPAGPTGPMILTSAGAGTNAFNLSQWPVLQPLQLYKDAQARAAKTAALKKAAPRAAKKKKTAQ